WTRHRAERVADHVDRARENRELVAPPGEVVHSPIIRAASAFARTLRRDRSAFARTLRPTSPPHQRMLKRIAAALIPIALIALVVLPLVLDQPFASSTAPT